MCVFLVCVLVLFRASVSAFRASELLVVRLSFVVKLFRLRSLIWSFRVEFWTRILSSILEFDFSNSRSRILKSNFEFDFFVSLLYSISRISIFDSSFEFKFLEFSCRICRRNFRFVALFDFSNFVEPFNFSKFVVLFDFSNFNFRFDFSIQAPWISNSSFSSSWSIRLLESSSKLSLRRLTSRISLLYSISRISIWDSTFSSSWSIRLLEFWFATSISCLVLKLRFESWVLH